MSRVRVGNLEFYYETQGKGHPLVLISGYTGDHCIWAPVREALAEHFQVVVFDNRGLGQSDASHAPYRIEDMAQDTLGIIEKLGLKQPHIIGHSMGSAVAQALALNHGQQLGKIILANSFLKLNPITQAAMSFLFHLRMDGVHPARIVEGNLIMCASQSFMANTKLVSQTIDMMLHAPHPQSESAQKHQLDALIHFDSTGWFKNISSQMLAICSEEDIICPPKEVQKHVEGMPNVKFLLIPEMAHMFHLEKPLDFVRIAVDFLK